MAGLQLGLGAGSFGVLLGLMGVGGVTSGMLLPLLRGRAGRGATVFGASLFSCAGMALLAAATHPAAAAAGMLLFGIGWVAAASTTQAAAQLVSPPWVRARALAIYQLSFNGALAAGSFLWGWLGTAVGLQASMGAAAALLAVGAVAVRGWGLDHAAAGPAAAPPLPMPEAPASELAPLLALSRDRVMETMRYKVGPADRDVFLAAMEEVEHVRGRTGAIVWRLYEDVAHPDGWMEIWAVANWTDHLREATRLSDEDRALLARVSVFADSAAPLPCRYIAVAPRAAPRHATLAEDAR